jgi:hypothetical protein
MDEIRKVFGPQDRQWAGEIIPYLKRVAQAGWHFLLGKVGVDAGRQAGRSTKVEMRIQAVDDTTPMKLTVGRLQNGVPVAILQLYGVLYAPQSAAVMARVRELYEDGTCHLILDLSQVSAISSVGAFTLRNLARLLGGQIPLDPEAGWGALHAMADCNDMLPLRNFKLLKPQPVVQERLAEIGLLDHLEIYLDLMHAVQAMDQPTSR